MKRYEGSRGPAQYRRPPEKVQGRRSGVGMDVVENIFFGVVMLLILAFAIVILRSVGSGWSLIGYSIVFWALMAYLALPRLHRTLTSVYVPSYFIGRTVTPDGLLGDPVNLDGNAAQRHHIRFWKCPEGWPLPGGGHRVQWLAAGTYDRAVGLSLFTLRVTHKIDADIDVERDYVVDSVLHAVPEAEVAVIEDFSTGYHSRNGGGDAVHTDGDLPVLELGHVPAAVSSGSTSSQAGKVTEHASSADDVLHDVAAARSRSSPRGS